MRIVYFGSGNFGLPTLKRLCSSHELLAVVSQPDRPAGRKRLLAATPVAQWAIAHQIKLFKSNDVNEPALVAQLQELHPDVGVVIAFGQKLSQPIIGGAGRLVLNLHASLLPKYRGAAPINWAIINGDTTTGVSVISLSKHMDAGLIYASSATEINPQETAGELHDRLALMGPSLAQSVLDDFQDQPFRELCGRVQDESQVTRAPKLSKADGYVDFNQPPSHVVRRIHGLTPWPGARVRWHDQLLTLQRAEAGPGEPGVHEPGTILENACIAVAGGTIHLLQVQLAGKRAMQISEFTRGHPLTPGDKFNPINK